MMFDAEARRIVLTTSGYTYLIIKIKGRGSASPPIVSIKIAN